MTKDAEGCLVWYRGGFIRAIGAAEYAKKYLMNEPHTPAMPKADDAEDD